MARVFLGLGSNIDPENNLRLGVRELSWRYGQLDLSPVYRSAALGFVGDDFLNMVLGLDSTDSAAEIYQRIEEIHSRAGRQRGSDRFAARPLDIDLLLYDDLITEDPRFRLPRSDVLEHSFVLRPLSELEPGLIHPETGRTMRDHWQEFDVSGHPLQPVSVIL